MTFDNFDRGRSFAVAFLLLVAAAAGFGVPAALAAPPSPDPDDGGIKLPAGFRALVVADNLGQLRFMAVAPNGDIYAKTREGGIIALRDTNGDGRAEVKETFGSGDAGRLYVEVGSPSNSYGDPDRAKGAKGKDPTEFLKTHGGFWRFDPSKTNQKQADGEHFSTGHRHILAIAWNPVSKSFFTVMNGRDQLGTVDPEHYDIDANAELPAEEMQQLKQGGNYGWPFTYFDPLKKARMLAPEFGGDNQKRAEPGKYPDPVVAFPAHWAPMQMAFYNADQFPAPYRGGAFVAFHGSWNRAPRPQKGYNVAFVPFDEKGMAKGTYEVFADGFPGREAFTNPGDARYRPCGLAIGPDGSLYVTDSEKGRIWRIVYTGTAMAGGTGATAAGTTTTASAASGGTGAVVYQRDCAVCHMPDGRGVPHMQPDLT